MALSKINTNQIVDGAVATADIADGLITTAKLADGAVTTAKITDGNISTAKLADDAVTNAKVANNAVGTSELADDAVTTAKVNPAQTDITSVGTLNGLNVTTGSSGASANSVVDDLVVQGSGRSGISILTPDANDGQLVFGSPSDNIGAFISYKQSTATMELGTSISNGVVKFNSGDGSLGMTLNASGNLAFASNKGIDFANASAPSGASGSPAETSTATVLDDYEEGYFTPVSNSVFAGSGSLTAKGMYVKIGNLVNISVRFTPSGGSTNGHQFGLYMPFKAGTTESSGSFNTWIGGVSFTSANGTGQHRHFRLGGDSNFGETKVQGTSGVSNTSGSSETGNFSYDMSITYRTID